MLLLFNIVVNIHCSLQLHMNLKTDVLSIVGSIRVLVVSPLMRISISITTIVMDRLTNQVGKQEALDTKN